MFHQALQKRIAGVRATQAAHGSKKQKAGYKLMHSARRYDVHYNCEWCVRKSRI